MIGSLSLTNFKCFTGLTLELGSINVFAGMNGAGKSTVVQSLLVLRQSWETGSIERGRLLLKGSLVDLGTAADVYCAEPVSDLIEITISPQVQNSRLCFTSRWNPQSDPHQLQNYVLELTGAAPGDLTGTASLFAEPFNYLHAERLGARRVYEISPDEGRPLWVGRSGENAPYIIGSDLRETQVASDSLLLESDDGNEYPTLHFQWVLWMARIFPGFSGDTESFRQADQIRLKVSMQKKTGQSLYFRPTNSGFGLSYVLGIVIAGLVAKAGSMLIVENPEAHLHPRAQSLLGEFLARVAAGGTQVVVETHSEHVVNGIRRVIKQKTIPADDVRIFFFGKEPDALVPVVTPIRVSPSGEQLSKWPDGFLDQLDNDLSVILS